MCRAVPHAAIRSRGLFEGFLPLVILVALLLGAAGLAEAQGRRRPPGGQPARIPPAIEFRGWDYATVGYTLSPGEPLSLHFRNNRPEAVRRRVSWSLGPYIGEPRLEGSGEVNLEPGATGVVPIEWPVDQADGSYLLSYSLGDRGPGARGRFYFDFRRPIADERLNLNLLALVENMDAEAWVRMMLGPLASRVNVRCSWPDRPESIDVAVVVSQFMGRDDPRWPTLESYVQNGGKLLVFGKPSPAFETLLPVEMHPESPWSDQVRGIATVEQGPWQDFEPGDAPPRYGMRVQTRPSAQVLARWADGTPAVTVWDRGRGKVVHVAAASGQVWQKRPSLDGADELALRLVYWLARGDAGVSAMLARAASDFEDETARRLAARDHALEHVDVPAPDQFVVVNHDNVGRFGWLLDEGGLCENLTSSGTLTGPAARNFSFGNVQPVVNVGTLQASGSQASLSLAVAGQPLGDATKVEQNWLSKSITRSAADGTTVRSTLSLASPAVLWEGKARQLRLGLSSATHLAYASKQGVRVVASGDPIESGELAEGWLVAFEIGDQVRSMPHLIVLTRKPESIRFDGSVGLDYGADGFGAVFASRLWGMRRLAPGATRGWPTEFPAQAAQDARRWNGVFLKYPVDCVEVAWRDGSQIVLVDRFTFRDVASEWAVDPITLAPLPPVLSLARDAGAPVELPPACQEMGLPTKFGNLLAVPGETTLVRLAIPPQDHRALIQVDGRDMLQRDIDRRAAGLQLGSTRMPSEKNEGAGQLHADLEPYDRSGRGPFNQAPCIDVYKWWYTFNAILARPVYSPDVRERVDQHFRTRYWETLNHYPHKCFVTQKREPLSGVEYLISFVWPTQTQDGYRNFNDANEASGINSYCLASYARYYGDWATLRANWNLCRRLHEYLPRVNDWAAMASGALESWRVVGLDMINSEPYGNLAFAYAADRTGHPQDALVGLVHASRSQVTAVARLALPGFLESITAEGDPWRGFEGHYWFLEDGIQASPRLLGSIGMHDTSKGTFHEQSLAYKTWARDAITAYERRLEAAGQNALPDLTQRLFLGWDHADLLAQVQASPPRQPLNFNAAKDLYDIGLAAIGDLPLFLSEWAPAEYLEGRFHPDSLDLELSFQSREPSPFRIRLYSQRNVVAVSDNGQPIEPSPATWSYRADDGWLEVNLDATPRHRLRIRLGEPVAPLHPYFTQAAPHTEP